MKLTELKSAVIITDPDEIYSVYKAHLDKVKERYSARSGESIQTILSKDDDGYPIVQKTTRNTVAKTGNNVPSLPGVDSLRELLRSRGMEWDDDYVNRTVPYWASDESVDTYGDIVEQTWDFSRFEDSSPLLDSHNSLSPPIGRVVDWSIHQRSYRNYNGPALWLLSVFARATDYDWADTIFRLTKAGILQSGSVGFRAGEVVDVKDPEERAALGLGQWGYVLKNNMLLEFSPTAIGANAGAHSILSNAKSKGLLQPIDMIALRELQRRNIAKSTRSKEEWSASEVALLEIARVLFPEEKRFFHSHEELDKSLLLDEEVNEMRGITKPLKKAMTEEEMTSMMEGMSECMSRMDVAVGEISQACQDMRDMLEKSSSEPNSSDLNPEDVSGDGETATGSVNLSESLLRLKNNLEKYRSVSNGA